MPVKGKDANLNHGGQRVQTRSAAAWIGEAELVSWDATSLWRVWGLGNSQQLD